MYMAETAYLYFKSLPSLKSISLNSAKNPSKIYSIKPFIKELFGSALTKIPLKNANNWLFARENLVK